MTSFLKNENVASSSALDIAFEKKFSRFVVGIDLGTTNCAVAFMDSSLPHAVIETFRIEQLVDLQTTQRSDTLPSFHYELTGDEANQVQSRHCFADGEHRGVVGIFARSRGMELPGRSIGSAKSWLCHPNVDRSSDMLPWSADENVLRVSPVEVSRRYLEHIRRMWDRDHPQHPLAEQEVVVTLPASFDEIARQLTLQAASDAGLRNVVLIEEPQAAFYAWLSRHQDSWMKRMRSGQSILVCDIGGGTTDFTLIRVVAASGNDKNSMQAASDATVSNSKDQSAKVSEELQQTFGLHRVAVGEHLMLGGDNLDLALAHAMEKRILSETPGQERLRPRQWDTLKAQCRVAKETLLGTNPPSTYALTLPGSGSKLIDNTRSIPVDLEWAREFLLDGFFGQVELQSRPEVGESGFQEFGLPYASEPNVNKHLAAFLWDHRWAGRAEQDRSSLSDLHAARPNWILFNGGVLESSQIQSAILQQIRAWFRSDEWSLGVLEGNRLDLAVAQGAAYFGIVRRGHGVRIDARLARTYYLLVEHDPPQVMCVLPAGAQSLDRFRLDQHPFELAIGQPVQFPLYQSSTNLTHQAGEIIPLDTLTMTPLPSIRTVLEGANRKQQVKVPVFLQAELTEIGTLQLHLVESALEAEKSPTQWKLDFDVRSAASMESAVSSDLGGGPSNSSVKEVSASASIDAMLMAMTEVFGPKSPTPPKQGIQVLSERVGQGRRDWSPVLLREMWRFLIDNQEYRSLSAEHEARWLNLVGWCLRPGFGMAADDWRVSTTWRHVHNKLLHRTAGNASESIVLWRRIAGGFTQGQQRALFQDCWPRVRNAITGGSGGQGAGNNVTIELLRLSGSLELLQPEEKGTAGDVILQALLRKKLEPLHGPLLWTLGRLGCRVPVYASLQQVVGTSKVQAWLEKLLANSSQWSGSNASMLSLCLMQLARRTHDRYRDHTQSIRDRIVALLKELQSSDTHRMLVETGGALDEENAETIVGEALPLGFRLKQSGN